MTATYKKETKKEKKKKKKKKKKREAGKRFTIYFWFHGKREKNKERRNALEQTMIDVLSLPLGLSFFEPASHERNNTPGPNSTQHRTFPFSKAHVNVILSICVEKRTSTICHSPDHKVQL